MADTKYTIVGMSSSGKTCFLTAMYMRMATGVDGFTLWTTEDTRRKYERDILALRKGEAGLDRFPAATPNAENATKLYEFRLIYDTKDIISFDVIDYAGGALLDGGPVYCQLKLSMEESTAMFIFIDGASLCDEDRTARKENVYYDCAMSVTPMIQDFADSHNGQLPPIVFVVTKSDLCRMRPNSSRSSGTCSALPSRKDLSAIFAPCRWAIPSATTDTKADSAPLTSIFHCSSVPSTNTITAASPSKRRSKPQTRISTCSGTGKWPKWRGRSRNGLSSGARS